MRSRAMRTVLGKPSVKGLMYLVAAMAIRAWMRRGRSDAHGDAPSAEHAGEGIIDLAPNAERDEQASFPPRGDGKPGIPA